MKYDLEERVAKFGERIIDLAKVLVPSLINKLLIGQLVRAGTSVGANYMEANQASSRKDFRNKITISRKESNESKHWLRMIARAEPAKKEECRLLWQEAHELTLIFGSIERSARSDKKV
jgi:four helix bundle protein